MQEIANERKKCKLLVNPQVSEAFDYLQSLPLSDLIDEESGRVMHREQILLALTEKFKVTQLHGDSLIYENLIARVG